MSLRNKKILVTLGPTWIKIDAVRVLSNISSGDMGQKIIKALRAKGAIVTALEGPLTCTASTRAHKTYKFCYFNELKELLTDQLKKKYDAVIHAAAVSDFRVKNPDHNKISSTKAAPKLTLVKTEKLINAIKKLRPSTFLVGFKLETSKDPKILTKKAENLFTQARCDLVVANTVKKKYQAFILNKGLDILAKADSRLDASRKLADILNKTL